MASKEINTLHYVDFKTEFEIQPFGNILEYVVNFMQETDIFEIVWNVLFCSGFLTIIVYAFLTSPYVLYALHILTSLIWTSWWRVQIMKLFIMPFSLASC